MTDDPLTAQLSLHAAAEQLTSPARVQVERDDAPAEYVHLPSLLDQLGEAVESSTSRGGAAAGVVYKSPAALDALGLLTDIEHETLLALRAAGDRRRWDTCGLDKQLRAWAAKSSEWRTKNQDYLTHAADLAQSWVTRARQILAPEQPTFELQPQPCPHCGERTAFVWSADHNEQVQKASLYFDKSRTSIRCRAEDCGAEWGADLFEFLRRLLADPAGATSDVIAL